MQSKMLHSNFGSSNTGSIHVLCKYLSGRELSFPLQITASRSGKKNLTDVSLNRIV